MKSPARLPWLSETRIDAVVQIEPSLIIIAAALSMWLLYTVLLRNVTKERHRSLRHELANLTLHAGIFGAMAVGFFSLELHVFEYPVVVRLRPWLGLFVLLQGAVTFVKTLKVLTTQLLFLGHMREGVPALLINTFTVVASLFTGGWVLAQVFDFNVAPLLATSAVASVVLGLAVQDPLGNLFAGIAMQIDKPYEIGDWVEVAGITGKWSGKVHEVTWRATVLIGLMDELVVIPNRVVGQSQVFNFTQRRLPILRGVTFQVPEGHDLETVREITRKAMRGIDEIVASPAPTVLFGEIGPGWVLARCNYWIDDYASQWRVGDAVIVAVVAALKANNLHLAVQQVHLTDDSAAV